MRLSWSALMTLPWLLAGCGSSSSDAISVTCDGSLKLAGAKSVTVIGASSNGGAALSFPDPARDGQTGTIPIAAGTRCVIAPQGKV